MTKIFGFDTKRDAQTKRAIGSTMWVTGIDHSLPASLMVVVSAGPAIFNPSGPQEWSKEVTYGPASLEAWRTARKWEIENKILPGLTCEWGRDEADLDNIVRTMRRRYEAATMELATL